MIEISGNITAERCSLSAHGHAFYAPIGQDIVCAAVSSLLYTLALCEEVEAEEGEGGIHLFGTADEKVCYLFRAIAVGLAQIAEQYPAYVTLQWGDYKTK